MHKKTADKFNASKGKSLPTAFFTIILHIESNSILVHTDNSMVTDGNPVGVFPKVVNNGLCSVEGLLAVGKPVLVIANVQ